MTLLMLQCLEMVHELFLGRCADGDLAAQTARPDVFVSDLMRLAE